MFSKAGKDASFFHNYDLIYLLFTAIAKLLKQRYSWTLSSLAPQEWRLHRTANSQAGSFDLPRRFQSLWSCIALLQRKFEGYNGKICTYELLSQQFSSKRNRNNLMMGKKHYQHTEYINTLSACQKHRYYLFLPQIIHHLNDCSCKHYTHFTQINPSIIKIMCHTRLSANKAVNPFVY